MIFEAIGQALGLAFPWFILVGLLVGLFGLVIPIFPGNLVIWIGSLLYGLVTGFDGRAIWFFSFISLLSVAAFSADNLLMGAKAKQAGAAWSSLGISLVAAIVASIFFTPLAGLVAAPSFLFLAEYFRNQRDSKLAWEITRELMIGYGWAFIVRFGLGFVSIGLYLWWAFG